MKIMSPPEIVAFIREGRAVQAGWEECSGYSIAPDAPPEFTRDMRAMFFAGGQHMVDVLLTALRNPDDDERQASVDSVRKELEDFIKAYTLAIRTVGNG